MAEDFGFPPPPDGAAVWPPPEWAAYADPFAAQIAQPPGAPIIPPSEQFPPPYWGFDESQIDAQQLPPPQLPPQQQLPPEILPQGASPAEVMPQSAPTEQNANPDSWSVDAISGGDMPPPPVIPEESPILDAYPEATAQDVENARQVGLTDEQRAAESALREDSREAEKAARRIAAHHASEEAAQEGYQTYQSGIAKWQVERQSVMTDLKTLQNQKIDADEWWDSRSSGQKFFAVLTAAMGGMLNPGGKNLVLDAMTGAIDRNVATQKANLENKRGAIGQRMSLMDQLYAQTGDAYRAAETARIGMLQGLEDYLASEAQLYDRAGTRGSAHAAAIAGVQARKQSAQAAMDEAMYQRSQDAAKQGLAERKFQASSRRHSAANGAVAPVEVVPLALTDRQRKERADAEISESNAAKTRGGPDGNPLAIGHPGSGRAYKQEDGSIFSIADDIQRRRVGALVTGSANIRRMADLVEIIRNDSGGASAAAGSKEYQELVQLAAHIDFETYVSFGLGAPSAGDTEMAQAAKGGKDITSYIYNPELGLASYATAMEEKLNVEARTAGYTGPTMRMPRVAKAEASERTKEENASSVLSPWPAIANSKSEINTVIESRVGALHQMLKQASPEEITALPGQVEELIKASPSMPESAATALRAAVSAASKIGEMRHNRKENEGKEYYRPYHERIKKDGETPLLENLPGSLKGAK